MRRVSGIRFGLPFACFRVGAVTIQLRKKPVLSGGHVYRPDLLRVSPFPFMFPITTSRCPDSIGTITRCQAGPSAQAIIRLRFRLAISLNHQSCSSYRFMTSMSGTIHCDYAFKVTLLPLQSCTGPRSKLRANTDGIHRESDHKTACINWLAHTLLAKHNDETVESLSPKWP